MSQRIKRKAERVEQVVPPAARAAVALLGGIEGGSAVLTVANGGRLAVRAAADREGLSVEVVDEELALEIATKVYSAVRAAFDPGGEASAYSGRTGEERGALLASVRYLAAAMAAKGRTCRVVSGGETLLTVGAGEGGLLAGPTGIAGLSVRGLGALAKLRRWYGQIVGACDGGCPDAR